MNKVIAVFALLMLSACATYNKIADNHPRIELHKPETTSSVLKEEFESIPPPVGPKVTVAVYKFTDLTGQRKPTATYASFSSAVTQGAEPFLINALQEVGKGAWFDVVERTNVDDLIKERTIIKQMRDAYDGKDAKALPPLVFAGLLMEGGIVGYDSSTESGGAAYKWLGIGPQTQYSKDIVTVSLRAVSVNSGKVLVAVTVQKIVYSTADSVAVLKFVRDGTTSFEAETGITINEPGTIAVKTTVEAAVLELIKEGERKGVWDYKYPMQIAKSRGRNNEVEITKVKKDEK